MSSQSKDCVDTLVVLDLDRTIFNIDVFVNILLKSIVDSHVIDTTTRAEIINTEQLNRGRSFDLVGYLSKLGVLPPVEELYSATSSLLYPGVHELFKSLEDHKLPHMILSYGSHESQVYKVRLVEFAIGRLIPFHITSEPYKARWLETLYDPPVFSIPLGENSVIQCRHITLVDDKPANLRTKSRHINGILVDNKSTVRRISDVLSTIIISEFGKR